MIEIENLSFGYENNRKPVLQSINLSISAGERVVLVGGSGSGKSTLLKLIAGFIAPVNGRILIQKRVVSSDGKILVPPHKRTLSMVFQDLALWPHMNVEENIGFGLKIRGVPGNERKAEVDKFLEMIGLKGYNKKSIDSLSGGEQQRVALARALILSPKILLMDEPLSSLDEELNIHLRKEIVALQERFLFTLVHVTHNKEEAEAVAHKIITLKEGKIIQ